MRGVDLSQLLQKHKLSLLCVISKYHTWLYGAMFVENARGTNLRLIGVLSLAKNLSLLTTPHAQRKNLELCCHPVNNLTPIKLCKIFAFDIFLAILLNKV